MHATAPTLGNTATPGQIDLINLIKQERLIDEETLVEMRAEWNNNIFTKERASQWIKMLKGYPLRRVTLAPGSPQFPEGRYALKSPDGDIRFFAVRAVQNGPEQGRLYVRTLASDSEYPVTQAQGAMILAEIAKDPEAASLLYGKEVKVCGLCGRTLTKAESRERGIGPDCAKMTGWGL